MTNFIPYGRQNITQADIDAVVDVLRSDFLTQGPVIPAFEKALTGYTGARHAVAVSNATCALHLACLALDVGPSSIVWTSPVTFVASANCARYCGATVDFVDIDPRTFNMSVERLAEKLQSAQVSGDLPDVVIPVHLCGQSCDMAAIAELGQRYGFRIIEDASHAIGGRYRDQPVGNCRYSDITVFSFHPVKIVTTGEGGAMLTNDAQLAGRMSRLRHHGLTRDPAEMTQPTDGPWYYQQIELGFNYRLTDIQAALGLSQMQRLDEYVARRHELAARYGQLLQGLPLSLPWQHPDAYSGLHLYVVRLAAAQCRRSHRQVFESLREQGIGVNLHYIPVHIQPYYARMGFEAADCPEAMRYYAEAISLPMFPTLGDADQDRVAEALRVATAS